MKNKTITKTIVLLVIAALLVGASVAGTVAYLIATSDPVVNTFTVGKVEITLDEAQVDPYGTPVKNVGTAEEPNYQPCELTDAKRVTANTYQLIPGHRYTKDPTVHVSEDSEDCWLFIQIDNSIAAIEAENDHKAGTYKIDRQIRDNWWNYLGEDNEGNLYYYTDHSKEGCDEAGVCDHVIFEYFITKAGLEKSELDTYAGSSLGITAYAVQMDGFEGVPGGFDAWNASDFGPKFKYEEPV